ncbi:TIGR04086 family membrane protein [Sinanaerobacter chloroacetimidivorans]|uniref:TIGR04086 family membrane protein n=1 Tax=Sinanaerobacter chloroacetimidivorans TaxID=2818044 RepID=A0A8J8B0B5_9FIRM|nr:TIGR04086 family membrane protein [Sinanaerobacter chloroacetimidivorans]MBR0596662.1 TIGR04086 family membrane protein [Sinanaerobacter chloroacetimidivorans]
MERTIKNIKGFVFALISFFLLTLVASVLVKFTPIPETWSIYYVMFALCLSCMFLGIYSGSFIKKKGFLYGALYSVIFILIISAIYMMAFSSEIKIGLGLLKYILCLLFGSIGGMIGVNMRL